MSVHIINTSRGPLPHGYFLMSLDECFLVTMQELGALASSYNICLHVDLCLGGFVLPFAHKLGYV